MKVLIILGMFDTASDAERLISKIKKAYPKSEWRVITIGGSHILDYAHRIDVACYSFRPSHIIAQSAGCAAFLASSAGTQATRTLLVSPLIYLRNKWLAKCYYYALIPFKKEVTTDRGPIQLPWFKSLFCFQRMFKHLKYTLKNAHIIYSDTDETVNAGKNARDILAQGGNEEQQTCLHNEPHNIIRSGSEKALNTVVRYL